MLFQFLRYIPKLFSRIIYYIIPIEYKLKPIHSLEKKLRSDLDDKTIKVFGEALKSSSLFNDISQIRKFSIKKAIENDRNQNLYYLEFGIFKGDSTNFFSQFLKKLYAFDSFKGLEEDWVGTNITKFHFKLNSPPKLRSNIEVVEGKVQDTLEIFLKDHKPKINFCHMDIDTYESTKFVLEKIKPYLVKNSIIIFDELYNFIGWEYGEYKALKEVFSDQEYKFLAFTTNNHKAVIKILN